MTHHDDTICAIATAPGKGAIAMVRISGKTAFEITDAIFTPAAKDTKMQTADPHSVHYGTIKKDGELIDDVVVAIYRGPKSFTAENTVEIMCHASTYIQQQIITLILDNGARLAQPGEFTLRAFMNGKLDLSQAEAVADLIASNSEASHRLAMSQMRGGFSDELKNLRQQLLDFVSLIELELDFSEEEVEFADRTQLKTLCDTIEQKIKSLNDSFQMGNVIKNGLPVAIVGEPNVGKSTLLNALLNEDRAIISEIPGTTRDTIEEIYTIGGISFRFIDTAGIRNTADRIETLGIQKTFEKIDKASVVMFLTDINAPLNIIRANIEGIKKKVGHDIRLMLVINKVDKLNPDHIEKRFSKENFKELADSDHVVLISAKMRQNLSELTDLLVKEAEGMVSNEGDIVVTNARHHEALSHAHESIVQVQEGLENVLSNDFLALDIRQVLHHLGEITGQITNDEMLGNIFANFCIGK